MATSHKVSLTTDNGHKKRKNTKPPSGKKTHFIETNKMVKTKQNVTRVKRKRKRKGKEKKGKRLETTS